MDQRIRAILRELGEATDSGRGGEVVLRSGERTGRIFFVNGRIAWVVASTIKKTFMAYLVENTGLSRDDLRAVFEACKSSGGNFGETIVEWGLLEQETIRDHLLQHTAFCLSEILAWPDLASMFVPEARSYSGSLTFEVREVLARVLLLDQEGRLPFAGARLDQILGAMHPAAAEEAAPEAAAPVPAAPADVPAGSAATPAVAPESSPAGRRGLGLGLVLGLVLAVGAAAGGIYYWQHRSKPATGDAAGAVPRANRDAAPAVPDRGVADSAPRLADRGPADGGRSVDGRSTDARATDARVADAAGPAGPAPIVVQPGISGGGAVRIVSYPGRARIFIDGMFTGRRTPSTLKRLTADTEHVILVERRGYRPGVKRFKLARGMQAQLFLSLKRRPRRRRRRQPPPDKVALELRTTPPGARVRLGRKLLLEPTPTTVELDPRRMTRVELLLKGHRRWRRMVRPASGVPMVYEVKLYPRRRRRHRRRRPR